MNFALTLDIILTLIWTGILFHSAYTMSKLLVILFNCKLPTKTRWGYSFLAIFDGLFMLVSPFMIAIHAVLVYTALMGA
tara:strand:- start:64 stop:300 length:237 start_codon:yes stop_codon:yes gene_type:complete